jgi:hypothetical protein
MSKHLFSPPFPPLPEHLIPRIYIALRIYLAKATRLLTLSISILVREIQYVKLTCMKRMLDH